MITKVGDRIRICWNASETGLYDAHLSFMRYQVQEVSRKHVRVEIGFAPHWIRSWVRLAP